MSNQKHGRGEYYSSDGRCYSGIFENGVCISEGESKRISRIQDLNPEPNLETTLRKCSSGLRQLYLLFSNLGNFSNNCDNTRFLQNPQLVLLFRHLGFGGPGRSITNILEVGKKIPNLFGGKFEVFKVSTIYHLLLN
jgi:hypothetical protein